MLLNKAVARTSSPCFKQISSIFKTIAPSHSTSSTIDSDEVDRFKKLSPTWWDEMGDMKALHSMNKLRVPLVRDGLINTGAVRKELIDTPRPLNDLPILEVGCGGGIFTEALARLGSKITGIDVSPELIQQAQEHAALDPSLSNLQYSLEAVENHVENNSERYEAIVTSEVLEHVADKTIFLEACIKCLKPGGSIFITTINKTTISWLGGIIFAENIMNFVPRGTHDWNKFIATHQTRRILEDNKCRTRLVHGMCYNFLTNKWGWMEDTNINYALHAVKDKL